MTPHRRLRPDGTTDESVVEYPGARSPFLGRLMVLPFEAAIAVSSATLGVASLFGFTAPSQAFGAVLPASMVALFNLLYILSGLCILHGLGWAYRNLEACGLILLITTLVVRVIMLAVTFGAAPSIMTALLQLIIFIAASITRLQALFKDNTIVQIPGPVTIPESGKLE